MGIFDKFKAGLKKTRDFVSDGFNRIAATMGRFDDEMLEDLEALLIQADLGVTAATTVMDQIRDQIRKTGDASGDAVLNQLRRSLLDILGPQRRLELQPGEPIILLLVGVNGTGKTTTAGKLCARLRQDGHSVILGAADTFRSAAIDQLKVWGERTGTPVIAQQPGSDPAAVVFDTLHAAKSRQANVVILDTAGRLHNKKNLMDELAKIRRIISREMPDARCETLLVIDATTGQNAVMQAKAFHEATEVTGLIITKLDGNAKGGVAIAVTQETGLPVYLAGLGERVDDLQDFDPAIFVESLLPPSAEQPDESNR